MEESIYMVKMVESSANKIEGLKHLNKKQVEITYTFPKEIRDQINRIRARSKLNYYALSLNYFDSRFVKGEKNLEVIRRDTDIADRELKEINPFLGAHLSVVKLDSAYVRQGELFDKIRYAIKAQIYGDLVERIEKIVKRGNIPDKTVDSLLKMCDKLENINILSDEEISGKITMIRDMIKSGLIAPVLEELTHEVKRMESTFAYVEKLPEEE